VYKVVRFPWIHSIATKIFHLYMIIRDLSNIQIRFFIFILFLNFFVDLYIQRRMFVYFFVCLFFLYAFGPCNSERHQNFHGTPLGPEEGQDGVGATKEGEEEGCG
jgi:hypothetical protein